jgi:hypothetical protein
MKWINSFLLGIAFLIFTTLACNFKFEEDVVVPAQKSIMVVDTQFSLDDEPFVLVTRTRNIGEPIKWDFNNFDILDKTPDTVIYNLGRLFDTVKSVKVLLYEVDSLIRTFEQYSPYTKVGYFAKKSTTKKM